MNADSFHRLAKVLLDTGEAASVTEALDTFSRYGVKIRFDRNTRGNLAQQILLLTAINCAARSFQGNVLIEGEDFELSAPGYTGQRLERFLGWCGIQKQTPIEAIAWPRIVVGAEASEARDLCAWSAGWDFGIGPTPAHGPAFAPACVAAAGLAMSEAFSLLRGDNPYAGHRALHLSLWNPTRVERPQSRPAVAPLQDALWLIGLGHLGQAYAWTLGFLPPGPRPLLLQDVDDIAPSTLSTSLLSHPSDIGGRKTRVVARWLEARGYATALVERRFDEAQRVRPEEPGIALFGVDNAAARRVLDRAGFRLVIDAGLGSGFNDFRGLRVRSFPGPAIPDALWASEPPVQVNLAPAYQRLLESGVHQCGVTLLATRAVGAPFVGCVAAGYVLAERIRRQLGGPALGFLDLHLRDPRDLQAA